tara:strand:- start:49 stop:1359 length:1311 start_codon:yes stop_codon:yes gene_type:complete
MSDWTFDELKKWDDKIRAIAESYNLDWHPINYEICDYYEMIGNMSYHGLPSHYSHWSFGKSFERTHQLYNAGMEGLPYELIINSNPSIAYLMRENPLYLQILIMAHCVGHSDFFKNNRLFQETRPESVNSRFRNAKKRIQEYVEDPNIGQRKVEAFIDNVHSIRYQTERNGLKRRTKQEIKQSHVDIINSDKHDNFNKFVDLERPLLEPDKDLLGFLIENGTHFRDWQIDILNIVKDESQYFIPQIKTKIINEGHASFWHYKILNELDLPQKFYIPFIKSHNQVVRPHIGGINPYHIGFHIYKKVEEKFGLDECLFIREVMSDESAIMKYLDRDDFRELNLFSFSTKREYISIDEISDEDGWKEVRSNFIKSIGVNGIPSIYVTDLASTGELILKHDFDGRELNLDFSENVVKNIRAIWPGKVKLFTVLEDESWEI